MWRRYGCAPGYQELDRQGPRYIAERRGGAPREGAGLSTELDEVRIQECTGVLIIDERVSKVISGRDFHPVTVNRLLRHCRSSVLSREIGYNDIHSKCQQPLRLRDSQYPRPFAACQ